MSFTMTRSARRSRTRALDGSMMIARPGEFLSDDQIRGVAPSVFATTAHSSRSDRFAPIPTASIIDGLRREGFDVTQASQSRSREVSRVEFTKHMLRFRRKDASPSRFVGQVFPEVVLVNANDGSSTYQLAAGLMRLICLNGMTVSDKEFERVRVTHTGDTLSKVIEGTYTVLDESIHAVERAERWASIDLDGRERLALAEGARAFRFADSEGRITTPITAGQLLEPRRAADVGTSLWATFNRIQEHVMRGGLHGVATDANNRQRRVTTRPVRGIDQDQRLNQALWHMAETLANSKAA
jgi:hypothetical protein